MDRSLIRAKADPFNQWNWYEVAKEYQVKSVEAMIKLAGFGTHVYAVTEGFNEYIDSKRVKGGGNYEMC